MITFLTSPKAFIGHANTIQRNAIRSWQAINKDVEVILYGDGENVSETCQELGVSHVPDVLCSPAGIPFFNSIVEHARAHAKYDYQCYLNCDIILTKSILNIISIIEFPRFLVIGQRLDLGKDVEIDVSTCNILDELLKYTKQKRVSLHGPTGMDYFLFTRGLWNGLPQLVVGRGGYDGALVAFCLRQKIPFINATFALPALHQYHDYGHVSGGQKTVLMGEDARNNFELHNIKHSIPNSADSAWIIIKDEILQNSIQKDWLRRIELTARFDLKLETISLGIRLLWRILVATGIYKIKNIVFEDLFDCYQGLNNEGINNHGV